jgi:tetratricopeptide (TPR) repeat protein
MLEPTAAELNESAMNHFSRGNGVEAARQLQWALIANPNYSEAWHNRAMVLRSLNDPFDAILCCERALRLDDTVAVYHNTMGVCWATMNQMEQARFCYDNALHRNPEMSEAWHNKAYAAKLSGLIEDAVVYYEKAVSLRPTSHDYHLAYASALLAAGRLAEGWHEYEHRLLVGNVSPRMMPLPEWHGEHNAALVLYTEQGFGDAIQFLRYAPILRKQYDIKVYVEVKKPLLELARTIRDIDGVIAYGDDLPIGATHALPLMSSPIYAGTNECSDIPRNVPYFFPGNNKTTYREATLNNGAVENLRIGLCWHGGVRPYQPELNEIAQRKSIPLHFLKPLSSIPGVTWVSLQLPAIDLPFPMIDLSGELYDFWDTANLINDLDLVVSVDTAVAHLAGALNVPVLLMTPKDNCWRWFGDAVDSPWYPSMVQIRQPSPGDWPNVIERVIRSIEHSDRVRYAIQEIKKHG